jgi:ribosomal protein S12 methylthiotransferase accessory factor
MGITRTADITGLDVLGIPVFSVVRPRGLTLQVSSGKGVNAAAAEASGVMEAVELFHAETPIGLRRATLRELAQGSRPIGGCLHLTTYLSRDYPLDWVVAEELQSQRPTWILGCSVFFCQPAVARWSSNGLASGNHRVEATLHGLYELIERDALARVTSSPAGSLAFMDPDTVDDSHLGALVERIRAAGMGVFLIRYPSGVPEVYCFSAVIQDDAAFAPSTRVTSGAGAHLDPAVAASRAVIEAAQARAVIIHASREDVTSYYAPRFSDDALALFARASTSNWRGLECHASADLVTDLETVLAALSGAGLDQVFSVDLTRPELDIAVVRMAVPGLQVDERILH